MFSIMRMGKCLSTINGVNVADHIITISLVDRPICYLQFHPFGGEAIRYDQSALSGRNVNLLLHVSCDFLPVGQLCFSPQA